MWNQIALGLLLVLVTTLVHAAAIVVALTALKRVSRLSRTHLDIALGADWRLLASFEAASGIIMVGWTTALVVADVQRLSGPKVDHAAR